LGYMKFHYLKKTALGNSEKNLPEFKVQCSKFNARNRSWEPGTMSDFIRLTLGLRGVVDFPLMMNNQGRRGWPKFILRK
jgi:hypothetical protein